MLVSPELLSIPLIYLFTVIPSEELIEENYRITNNKLTTLNQVAKCLRFVRLFADKFDLQVCHRKREDGMIAMSNMV